MIFTRFETQELGTQAHAMSSFCSFRSQQRGMSLIELMVALVIGLVMSLAIYGVLTVSEGRKRTTTSVNDIDQAGAYALYQLDKIIRSAGSGISSGRPSSAPSASTISTYTFGCQLYAARNSAQVLPAATFPVPFSGISTSIRLAPLIIVDGAAGAGGDVLITMAGASGLSEAGAVFTAKSTGATLKVINQAAFRASDVVLVAGPAATTPSCLIEQVASGFVPTADAADVPLGGEFFQAVVSSTALTSFPDTAVALSLGQNPAFSMFGVGSNNTMMIYDLLRNASVAAASPNPSIFMDGVYQMHALYGIDTGADPAKLTLDWVQPTGNYAASALLAGNSTANARLATIKAVRVALVMRTNLPEKAPYSSPATVKIFGDVLTTAVDVPLSPLNYRYRVFEATIPIINPLML